MRAALVRWYDRNKRDLPWRKTRDPYAIWVSETMLQQTQVATVLPYYRRFMEAFPSVEALDRAPLDTVRSVWSGLGYYRRAANLKQAARLLMSRHGGRLPADYQALLRLPGIGRYTAGAVMSIAFGRPCAAPDGNVRRVYARLLGLRDPKQIDAAAEQMVSRSRPGDFNQAVMELGATVCLPAAPLCERCPLIHWCRARASGAFDVPRRQPARTKAVEWPLVLVESRSRILLHRRPEGGLLAGLWELPRPETLPTGIFDETLRRSEPVTVIRHAITDMRITAPVYVLRRKVSVKGAAWRWVSFDDLSAHPLSSLSTKAVRVAERHLSVAKRSRRAPTQLIREAR
ncbi:MAG: A/G-specific adenine glycosylase [Deltaproteobacteria bacterium]|nr:A/G-specific adenine glycosylase [Deltaproteobacteria bacterium]